MTWNYRVLEEVKDGVSFFRIVEVYYDDQSNFYGFKVSSADILVWDNFTDLKGTYEKIRPAFDKPVLRRDENGFPYDTGRKMAV